MTEVPTAPHAARFDGGWIPITLALAGDVMLGRLVNEMISERGFAYPWGDLLPVIRRADGFFVNLECAITANTERWSADPHKPFFFRADPEVVRTLEIGGVDFASFANNHVGDFGVDGLLETLQILDQSGIAHSGAGPDLPSARTRAQLTVGGYRIGIVSFADYPADWAATDTLPGMNYTPISLKPERFAIIEQALAATRDGADLVIFSIHWGPNMRARPPAEFRQFAHRIIEAGADIFWGHSAHVVQGVEIWQGKPILYDTGDFVDDYRVDAELRNDRSALFLVQARPPVIERVELVPVQISHMQVNLATGAGRDWFIDRFTTLCAEMGTNVAFDGKRLSISCT